jgi:hypothetical protein
MNDNVQELPSRHVPGVLSHAELAQFAGSIPADDLAAMETAIEEGCEQIDPESWDVELPG